MTLPPKAVPGLKLGFGGFEGWVARSLVTTGHLGSNSCPVFLPVRRKRPQFQEQLHLIAQVGIFLEETQSIMIPLLNASGGSD